MAQLTSFPASTPGCRLQTFNLMMMMMWKVQMFLGCLRHVLRLAICVCVCVSLSNSVHVHWSDGLSRRVQAHTGGGGGGGGRRGAGGGREKEEEEEKMRQRRCGRGRRKRRGSRRRRGGGAINHRSALKFSSPERTHSHTHILVFPPAQVFSPTRCDVGPPTHTTSSQTARQTVWPGNTH